MSWQSDLFLRLRSREWQHLGTLFEAFECAIPLHYATRHYVLHKKPAELPSNFEARWLFFRDVVRKIGVDRDDGSRGGANSLKWNTRIRLQHLASQSCAACGGPVIRDNWSGKRHRCLACADKASAPTPQPALPAAPPPAAPPPAPVPLSASQNVRFVWNTRRDLARNLKWMLGGSINAVERELEHSHDDVEKVLARRGSSWPKFIRWLVAHVPLTPYQGQSP